MNGIEVCKIMELVAKVEKFASLAQLEYDLWANQDSDTKLGTMPPELNYNKLLDARMDLQNYLLLLKVVE